MTITFELSTEQASRIENARQQGIPLETLFDAFLAHLPNTPPQPEPEAVERRVALITLLHQWNAEDNDLNLASETDLRQEGERFSANLSANRVVLPVPGLPE